MDSLGELGVALLATSPVAGRGSTRGHALVSSEPSGFAAHMQETPQAELSDPPAQASRHGKTTSQPPTAGDSTDLLTSRQTMGLVVERSDSAAATPSASDRTASLIDTVPQALLNPEGEAAEPEAAAARHRQDAASDGPTSIASMAATMASASSSRLTPDEPVTEGVAAVVPGDANDASEPSKSDPWPRATTLEPNQSRTLEPLLTRPANPPMTQAEVAGGSDRQTDRAAGPTVGEKGELSVVPASDGNIVPGALPAPDQAVATSSPESPAPVSLAGAGPAASSEQPRMASDPAPNRGTVEPMAAGGSGQEADGGIERLLRERSAATDVQDDSQAGDAAERTSRQPVTDGQLTRLANVSNPPGSTTLTATPAIAGAGDLTPSIHRAPDSAATVEAGRHAAAQVALEITKSLDQHRTEIRIQLDPPELGDVDIRLEFRDMRLTATVSTERLDTLDLLQRDARSLARAFREAGFELADSDLSFAYNGRHDRSDASPYPQRTIVLPHDVAATTPLQSPLQAMAGPDGYVSLRDGRMDLRA